MIVPDSTESWYLLGEYIPQQSEFARFVIEGEKSAGIDEYPEVYVDEDCQCICYTCNKYVMLTKGESIPPCCGKLMETVD